MADYNLTKSAAAVDATLNLIDEATPKNSDSMLASAGVPLNSTVTRSSVLHADLAASSTAYGDNGNGVTAAEAAIAIKGAKDGNIGVTTVGASPLSTDFNTQIGSGFSYRASGSPNAPQVTGQSMFSLELPSIGADYFANFVVSTNTRGYIRGNPAEGWRELWTSGNTTVDGSGFIKEASPIIKLFSDYAEFNEQCQEGAEFKKVSTGHYLIKNTLGFAKSGWYIENPKDANGNVKVYVEFEQLPDNTLEIKTYTPDYSNGACGGSVSEDIPTGRWIDLRLHKELETTEDLGE